MQRFLTFQVGLVPAGGSFSVMNSCHEPTLVQIISRLTFSTISLGLVKYFRLDFSLVLKPELFARLEIQNCLETPFESNDSVKMVTDIFFSYICPSLGVVMSTLMYAAPVGDLRAALVEGKLGSLNPLPWAVMTGNCLVRTYADEDSCSSSFLNAI